LTQRALRKPGTHVTDKLAALTFAVHHHHEQLPASLKDETITSRQLNEAQGAQQSLVGCCGLQELRADPVSKMFAATLSTT
jgi:hypothetical protein